MSLPVEVAKVVGAYLEAAGLSADTIDNALEAIGDELDAAGIRTAAGPGLDALLARHHVYRTALQQLGHAIETSMAESTE